MTAIAHRIEDGCLVGWLPSMPHVQARVRLSQIAQQLARRGHWPMLSGEEIERLDALSGVEILGDDVEEVGWGFLKKAWSATKSVAKKTMKVAKKVVDNKVVKMAYESAKQATPMPYQAAIIAAEGAVRFGTAIAKNMKKAKKLQPAVKAAAEGKLSTQQLQAAARAVRVSPKIALHAAAAGRLHKMAERGDQKAKAALHLGKELAAAKKDAKVARRVVRDVAAIKNRDKAKAIYVRSKSGKEYRATVVPV